jgi:hypothetical protein
MIKMTCDRIDNATELFCFKVTYDDGDIYYYVDTSISDASKSASEIDNVKTIEYIGKGMVGN